MHKFFVLVVGLALMGCSAPAVELPIAPTQEVTLESSQDEVEKQTLQIGDQSFLIEIADTPDERQVGLMNREFMPENEGMLFIFDGESERNFWMKNTLIPLDMIWIDANRTIVDIQAAEPCRVENCPTYPGAAPAQYVLELNQGVLRAEVGDTVEF